MARQGFASAPRSMNVSSRASSAREGTPDSALLDEAFAALLSKHRAAEVDASYATYDEHPLTEVEEWGDLASFREAAAAS